VSATAPARVRHRHDEFQHEALLYAGDDEYLATTVPFVTEGVAAGEAVMVAVPEPRLSTLRDAVADAAGDVSDQVSFFDMALVGANPARIIPVWRDFLDAHRCRSRPVRGIGEPIWAGRSPDELVECQHHESLLNVAFAGSGRWRPLCPYDTVALDPAVVDEARRSHPLVTRTGVRGSSADCRDLDAMAQPFDAPLPAPPGLVRSLDFGPVTLASVRRFVAGLGAEVGLRPPRLDDLLLAVHEVATNSVLHGGGTGVLRGWYDAERIVFEVADSGRIADPLVGRARPAENRENGRGVWMANQLCDLVQLRTFATGNVIRIHMRRP
jgi:anti-sigma regulatory factor (Ser/Thr protein kinase)